MINHFTEVCFMVTVIYYIDLSDSQFPWCTWESDSDKILIETHSIPGVPIVKVSRIQPYVCNFYFYNKQFHISLLLRLNWNTLNTSNLLVGEILVQDKKFCFWCWELLDIGISREGNQEKTGTTFLFHMVRALIYIITLDGEQYDF